MAAHGTSKGTVDGKFKQRIANLEERVKKSAEHFKTQSGYRDWNVPKELHDPLDVPSLHVPAWERNSINQLYSETILVGPGDAGGTCGDIIAMKWQADFMATEERAFRMRHASFTRSAAAMHSRLKGHGTGGQGVFSVLEKTVASWIELGGVSG